MEDGHVERLLSMPKRGETSLFNRSLRSRRATLLAGGCCSALLAAALPSAALAQTADQAAPAPAPAPADVNAPQAEDQNAIVVTGFRRSLQDSINIKRRERGTVEAVSPRQGDSLCGKSSSSSSRPA